MASTAFLASRGLLECTRCVNGSVISGDGLVQLSSTIFGIEAFRWTEGNGLVGLGLPSSSGFEISGDGNGLGV